MFKASSYDHEAAEVDPSPGIIDYTKGEKQPKACKDVPFAILFNLHLLGMVAVAALLGGDAIQETIQGITSSDVDTSAMNDGANNYSGYVYTAVIIGVVTLLSSSLLLTFMIRFASILVKTALIFSVVLSLLSCAISLYFGNMIGGIFGIIFFLLTVCYAKLVWHKIPFATANLVTGLTAVKKNIGIIFLSFIFVILALAWSVLWTIAFLGVYDKTQVCNEDNVCTMNYGYLFLLLISYYWTHQVIMNTIHVTVAGLIGTWWFTPAEASSCCSSGVTSSLIRATTYSHGSICFGSLLVAIIQALRQLANQARAEGDGNQILQCIAECILSCLESILEYFNKWAYVYVGLYGYGYIEAGKNVMNLFKSRGWEVIITDDLVSNTLFMLSLIVGLIMGAIGLILESSTDWFVEFGANSQLFAFLIAFLVGLVLCSIMLSVVASAVNTVIVCFAESPADFQNNHPELSNKMRSAWIAAYPEVMDGTL